MLYYEILDDNERFADRWFLTDPLDASGRRIDAREFTYGQRYSGATPTNVPIGQLGRDVQFHLGAFDMPVVSRDVAAVVEAIAPDDVECFPVTVASSSNYVIMNVVARAACVDEQRSTVMWWKPEDGRPDKVGKYRMLSDLTIDPTRTGGHHIFRIQDYEIVLIVSEEIKDRLGGILDLGVVFKGVC